MLSEAITTDYTKLLSTEAGLRAVRKWFLEQDVLTQFSLARRMDDAEPRRATSYCNVDSLAKKEFSPG
jgi:hypothetical protein